MRLTSSFIVNRSTARSPSAEHPVSAATVDLQFAQGQVLAVEENRDQHRLVAIDLADGARHLLAEGADFYVAPTLSPDASRLAWIEWNCPTNRGPQPADGRRMPESDAAWPGLLCGRKNHAENLQQPRFDRAGRLFCLTDRGGYWSRGWHRKRLIHRRSVAADDGPAPWQWRLHLATAARRQLSGELD